MPSDEKPTMQLDPRDIRVSWPLIIASLEQIGPWAVFALRLGTLALIKECINEAAERSADPTVVARMRALIEALAHMPLDLG